MSAAEHDRGLNAVRRVRDSREQDSRFGLQHALNAVRRRDSEVEQARARRTGAASFAAGSITEFRSHVAYGAGLAELERQAVDRAENSRLVAEEATRRWQHDRQQVRVVDLLLERRADQRAQERARREAHELDDLATQAWLRARTPEENA
jgi:flagellar export protein FliJ